MSWKSSMVAAIGFAAFALPATAQEFQANKAQLSELYTGKAYSPYAQRKFFRSGRFGATTICIPRCRWTREDSAIVSAFEMPIVLLAVRR